MEDLNRFIGRKEKYRYGHQWGNPDVTAPLYWWIRRILQRAPGDLSKLLRDYIKPYVKPDTVALEIGSGGGRWTRYLLGAREIIVVDLNSEFFSYLQECFKEHLSRLRFYHTSGYELDGIETDHVDFIFSFGTFVHIDPDGIYAYLGHIRRVLRPGGIAVIQYSNKTKLRAWMIRGFSDMNPDKMEDIISRYGFRLVDHNVRLLNHSSIAVIQKCL